MPHERDSPHHTSYKEAHHIRGSISQGGITILKCRNENLQCCCFLGFYGVHDFLTRHPQRFSVKLLIKLERAYKERYSVILNLIPLCQMQNESRFCQ